MTAAELEVHAAAKLARGEQRARERVEKRTKAQAALDAWVDSLPVPGDLPLSKRERRFPANEATMRGMLIAKFPRPKGAQALVLLREWEREIRLLFTLLYVEDDGEVRSRGWTLYLRDVTADGEVVPSVRELDELIVALTGVRDRIASGDPSLAAEVERMREAREAWARQRAGGAAASEEEEVRP